mgnify:CR=1 FL=1
MVLTEAVVDCEIGVVIFCVEGLLLFVIYVVGKVLLMVVVECVDVCSLVVEYLVEDVIGFCVEVFVAVGKVFVVDGRLIKVPVVGDTEDFCTVVVFRVVDLLVLIVE